LAIDCGIEGLPVLYAELVGAELVCWDVQDCGKGVELSVCGNANNDPVVVCGLVGAVWSYERVAVAHPLVVLAADELAGSHVREGVQGALQQARADVLALTSLGPMKQGCQDALGDLMTSQDVSDSVADFRGSSIRLSSDVHEPSHRLHVQIESRLVPPGRRPDWIPGDRCVDQPLIQVLDTIIIQA